MKNDLQKALEDFRSLTALYVTPTDVGQDIQSTFEKNSAIYRAEIVTGPKARKRILTFFTKGHFKHPDSHIDHLKGYGFVLFERQWEIVYVPICTISLGNILGDEFTYKNMLKSVLGSSTRNRAVRFYKRDLSVPNSKAEQMSNYYSSIGDLWESFYFPKPAILPRFPKSPDIIFDSADFANQNDKAKILNAAYSFLHGD